MPSFREEKLGLPTALGHVRSFTFADDGALGMTMRQHHGRALVAQVSGQAAQLGVPVNCMLLAVDGRNLNAPYKEVVATLATMPRPFVLDVQLAPADGKGEAFLTPEERTARAVARCVNRWARAHRRESLTA